MLGPVVTAALHYVEARKLRATLPIPTYEVVGTRNCRDSQPWEADPRLFTLTL